MGVSTDAYLFYGYLLPDDYEVDDDLFYKHFMTNEVISIGRHCSDECDMKYVCIAESESRAYRGYPQKIDDMHYKMGWDVALNRFIEEHDLPRPGEKVNEYGDAASEFGWWLASYWG